MKRARIDTVPGLKEEVAELHAQGATQEEIAEVAGVSDRGTVAAWLSRPDVQSLVQKIVADRATGILRHTDSAIQKILEQKAGSLSLDQLLKIRDRFAGQTITFKGGDETKSVEEFMRILDENPQMAAAMKAAQPDDSD